MDYLTQRLRGEHEAMLRKVFGTARPNQWAYDKDGKPILKIGDIKSPMSEAIARIEALEAEVARLRGAVQKADDHLTNLQPHIPQACYPGHEGFIDSHVDCAQEVLRAALTPPHVQHTAGVDATAPTSAC